MEDISGKPFRTWQAVAQARVKMKPDALVSLVSGETASGDVLAAASIGGVLGAKQCQSIIPVKHPQMLAQVKVEFGIDSLCSAVDISARVKSVAVSSAASDALAAAFAAALTIFELCRSLDSEIAIEYVRLIEESDADGSPSYVISEQSEKLSNAALPLKSRRLRVVSETDPVVPLPKRKSKVKAKPKAKTKLKPKTKSRAKVKSKPKVKARAKIKAKAKPKLKAKPKVKTRAKAKPKPKAKVKAKSKAPGKSRRKTKRNVKGR